VRPLRLAASAEHGATPTGGEKGPTPSITPPATVIAGVHGGSARLGLPHPLLLWGDRRRWSRWDYWCASSVLLELAYAGTVGKPLSCVKPTAPVGATVVHDLLATNSTNFHGDSVGVVDRDSSVPIDRLGNAMPQMRGGIAAPGGAGDTQPSWPTDQAVRL